MRTLRILGVIIGLAAVAFAMVLLVGWHQNRQAEKGEPVIPQQVVVIGRSVCLPHRDTSGPQTMECAFGLEAENGSFYALDGSAIDEEMFIGVQTAEQLRISGMMTPVEMLSSDQWQKYAIEGIIQVETVEVLIQ